MVSSSLSSFRFVDAGLHRFHPLDIDILVGLATVVVHQATFQVCLLQERHIHECHASEIETEQKQVSCLVKGGTCWQVQVFYLANILYRDGSPEAHHDAGGGHAAGHAGMAAHEHRSEDGLL